MTTDHEPKVSVIIPLYNQRRFVGEAIQSALGQSYGNVEVIVVDDGSTDDPARILEQYGSSIKVVSQENKGLAGARNTGIRHSTGEYLQFLDADDILYPNKIEIQLRFSLEKRADATYCELDRLLHDTREITHTSGENISDFFLHLYCAWNRYPAPIHSLLFRKSLFDRVGVFPEDLRSNEDRYLLSVMAARGVSFHFFRFRGGIYRIHDSNMTSDKLLMARSKIDYYRKLTTALGDDFIREKTGFSGFKMMEANLTFVYLMAVSEGEPSAYLRQLRQLFQNEGITLYAKPIPSRFGRSILTRKLVAAYFTRYFARRCG